MSDTTWHTLIRDEMARHKEGWHDAIDQSPWCGAWLDEEPCRGGQSPRAFAVWTYRRVYFPVVTDAGAVSVASAPRYPCEEPVLVSG